MATSGLTDGSSATATPKITLYTNHHCPYAHRAHITLKELQLPFQEVLIDLQTPRPQWYLDINPRGLVPSIKFSIPAGRLHEKEEIVTESAVVTQFLCDAFPSHLLPALQARGGGGGEEKAAEIIGAAALKRARMKFFIDTWDEKVGKFWFETLMCEAVGEKERKVEEWIRVVEKEIEPLLQGAGPFFGGSESLTLVEVHTGPFLLRWYALAESEDLLPRRLVEGLDGLGNFGRWSRAVREHGSVRDSVEWEGSVDGVRRKIASLKGRK